LFVKKCLFKSPSSVYIVISRVLCQQTAAAFIHVLSTHYFALFTV
jgi:hypothetical protein